jgi:hypothetical protein
LFFSSKNFENNPNGWSDSLARNYYALPAIVPPMPWIDSTKPAPPTVQKTAETTFNVTAAASGKKIKALAIYALPPLVDEKFEYSRLVQVITTNNSAVFVRSVALVPKDNRVYVASVDLNNNVSDWVEMK